MFLTALLAVGVMTLAVVMALAFTKRTKTKDDKIKRRESIFDVWRKARRKISSQENDSNVEKKKEENEKKPSISEKAPLNPKSVP